MIELFNEKLDYIMNLTEVTNSSLARVALLDPSYISRLRRGKRKLPNKQNFLASIVEYFSNIIEKNEKMKEDFLNVISLYYSPEIINNFELSEIMYEWLAIETNDSVLNSLKLMSFSEKKVKRNEIANSACHFYYGSEGKREASIRFLNDILSSENPTTIYLYSEESMKWFYEDPIFNIEISSLLKALLSKNYKIKIIHNVDRDLNELSQALNIWIPVYLSGKIESYYYPLIRDDIYRRTLFIAPGISAISSISVKDKLEDMMSLYTSDKAAINSLFTEYSNYFELCVSAINSYDKKEDSDYLQHYISYYDTLENTYVYGLFPSISTMPEEIAAKIGKTQDSSIISIYNSLSKSFKELIMQNTYTETILLPDIKSVLSTQIFLPESITLLNKKVIYTVSEFKQHLDSIVNYLKEFENYNVIVYQNHKSNPTGYISRMNSSTLILNMNKQGHFMEAVEPNMSLALCQYLSKNIQTSKEYNREETIKVLEEYSDKLGKYL